MEMIRCVIFDLGGTLIDKFSMSPLVNLRKAFAFQNIPLCNSLVSKDMGMKKFDHICTLSKEVEFKDKFKQVYGRSHDDTDLFNIYNIFCSLQRQSLRMNVDLIPGSKKAIHHLQENDIKVAVNTGFSKDQMNIALDLLHKHDIVPDASVSSTCYNQFNKPLLGRPHPHMIHHLMDELQINDPKQVLKVDDTCVGIQEGKNAGCLTVGVARWSIHMNVFSKEEEDLLTDTDIIDKLNESRKTLLKEDPTYVINTLDELQHCLIPLYLSN
jgi:phosphonoacetaldehyde hydrolase